MLAVRWRRRQDSRSWHRLDTAMPERDPDFELILTKLTEARESGDGQLRVSMERVQQQSDSMASLMSAAQDLAEPQPQYFTRG